MRNANKGNLNALLALVMVLVLALSAVPAMAETYYAADATVEQIVTDAAAKERLATGGWATSMRFRRF